MDQRAAKVYVNGGLRVRGLSRPALSSWLRDLLGLEGRPRGEVSLTFVDTAGMTALNERYTGRRGTTDVLAFSQQEGYPPAPDPDFLGDVLVDLQRVRAQARDHGVATSEEVLRVVAHGFLHLVGYDHATDQEEVRMRQAEERHIRRYRGGEEA
ncbi:MAG: rRNA maturation RNase YbeY [Candidatus Eisenbacteria bacterium]|jgi:rRNA maturation RNase YbeY|nr:rRNA maturation RNase YbeY [Candidatus Eisenbacteria bacterium]